MRAEPPHPGDQTREQTAGGNGGINASNADIDPGVSEAPGRGAWGGPNG
jgi:hypothetical protein